MNERMNVFISYLLCAPSPSMTTPLGIAFLAFSPLIDQSPPSSTHPMANSLTTHRVSCITHALGSPPRSSPATWSSSPQTNIHEMTTCRVLEGHEKHGTLSQFETLNRNRRMEKRLRKEGEERKVEDRRICVVEGSILSPPRMRDLRSKGEV